MEKDITTEQKIKEAARVIFQQKGFAGARTRDIAEAAGINLALLNYYYRSKEKLFELVMEECIEQLFMRIRGIMNEESTTLSEKIDLMVNTYLNLLIENPNIPIFVLGELQANPEKFKQKMGDPEFFLSETTKQLKQHLQKAGMENLNPLHIIANTLSMTIFPFIAKPMLKILGNMDEADFMKFIEERRTLIPEFIKSFLKIDK